MACGNSANILFAELLDGEDFPIPEVDLSSDDFKFPFDSTNSSLYSPVKKVENCDLTERRIGGDGTFDAIMASVREHIAEEFKLNRITGAEYSKAYVAITESALSNAVQFVLQKDAAYWQSQSAQIQALTARIQLETAKAALVATQYNAMTAKAQYATAKMQALNLCTENQINQYRLTQMLPIERDVLEGQKDMQLLQIEGQSLSNEAALYNISNMLPQQLRLLTEQTEAQRAQTLDTRSDGSVVVGQIGKQKDLYSEQITSYKRDVELKFAKNYLDAWITQKTVDDGLAPPNNFTNTTVDGVFNSVRTKVGV